MNSGKTSKIKPRLPRGLEDRGPAELRALREMTEAIRGVYERYGFEAVETPAIEPVLPMMQSRRAVSP